MPTFQFVAEQGGRTRRGRVEAPELRAARARLERQFDKVVSLDAETSSGGARIRVPVTALALSVRQLATMVKAGLALHSCMDALTRGDHAGLNRVFGSVGDGLRAGLPLSVSMSRHPDVFSPYFLTLVRAGEVSGNLDRILEKLAESLERQAEVQHKLWAALTYPLLSLALAAGVVLMLIYGVIPVMKPIFGSLGMELPLLTQIVMVLHGWATDWRVLVAGFGALALIAGGFRLWVGGTAQWQRAWRRAAARLPVIGTLARKIALANLLYALSAMLESGVQILPAFQVLESLDTDADLQEGLAAIRKRVVMGDSFAQAVEDSGLFPAMVASMLRVGEESGRLDDMMRRTGDTFEFEVQDAQSRLVALTEPLVLTVLGGVTGVVVLAAILPILKLLSSF